MEGLVQFLERHFMPVAGRLAEQRHLKALRDGVVATIPLLLIGSFFLIIAFPPIPSLAKSMEPFINNLLTVVNATFGIMGLIAAFSVAYSLATSYKMDTLAAGVFGVAAFILAVPFTKDGNIAAGMMGSKGLFVAMILAIVVVEIQRFMIQQNIVFKIPDGVPPTVARSFAAIIPGFVILVFIWLINTILASAGALSIPEVINRVITTPLLHLGGSLLATLAAIFVMKLLWCFGIHGTALVDGVMRPIWMTFTEQNAAAKVAGEALPNIICQQFVENFVYIGGSGVALAAAFLLFAAVKSKQLKALGKTALWPAIFNISEPIVFGLPIVMNPIMIVPFILAPVACVILTYLAMTAGIVDKPYAYAPWTTPAFFSGFLVTGDWKASVLQVVNFAVAVGIYYPFVKAWDNVKTKEEQGAEVNAAPPKSHTLNV